ncbi:arginine--tRNA ligase [Aerococcus sp. UMB10185]|uniref:arginine--tRNA ligase n=1 Tax=Aerococcus sp. UMB10185 TaxID=3046357 RepID=UPI0025511D77|nr:arginine--tRNA ligase [Aerococcus sp. UMB10185]MDK6234239.1 arginine--tRNA ligase [Aerococcus sp. UMB10185]
MDLKHHVAEVIYESVSDHLDVDQIEAALETPKHSDHGDIAFPCFLLAKALRKAPQAIAQELAAEINDPALDKVEAVGPYLNFFLKPDQVSKQVLKEILSQGSDYGQQDLGHGGNVTIDMSSPNIAKPMSMGHLRSTVIGNAIGNILAKVGFNPIRINHLGDWGTQFGKLIVAYRLWGTEEEVRANPIQELLRLYVKFHEEAEEDESLNDKGRQAFKALEEGSEEELTLWRWFRSESLKEFNRIYAMLGIEFDSDKGEAFYNDKMDRVIELLEEKDLLKVDNGATIVDLDKYDLIPALVKKSDGATLYMTRDLAAALYRKDHYDFAQSLYVVGNEQSIHFKQLKAVLKEMGYDWYDDIHHIPFGLVTKDGKKLSTRKGKVVLLEEVLNEAIRLAEAQIEEKNPDLANKDQVAHQVGVGAVIFHDLKNDRMNNFDFKLSEIVQFEGETAPYVQYANARAHSILRKSGRDLDLAADYTLEDSEAYTIVKALNDFPETIEKAYRHYEPSVIAKYAINLAQNFNRYYAHNRILEEDEGLESRLALVKATTIVLEAALNLLGVAAPHEM